MTMVKPIAAIPRAEIWTAKLTRFSIEAKDGTNTTANAISTALTNRRGYRVIDRIRLFSMFDSLQDSTYSPHLL